MGKPLETLRNYGAQIDRRLCRGRQRYLSMRPYPERPDKTKDFAVCPDIPRGMSKMQWH